MKKITLFLAVCMLLFSVTLPACIDTNPPSEIKNVIIFIGDGMGFNHIENAKTYFGINKFCFEDFEKHDVTTHSKNNSVTDSAAAATALATGTKVNNGNVSRLDGQDLKHIMAIAKQNNKKTGVVTSDKLYGATPACFSSHANNRNDTTDIIHGQLTSGIDVFIGEQSSTYSNYKNDFENMGYTFASTVDELLASDPSQKVIGNIKGMRSQYNENLSNQVDYAQLVESVLNRLDNENGFCLMVENSFIDKCSHNNDAYGAVCEARTFADMIQKAINFCKNRNDTMIIVTADHETGGFGKASTKEEVTNSLYTTGSHTAANVPLYLFNYAISDKTIDNTQIFDICKKVICNA